MFGTSWGSYVLFPGFVIAAHIVPNHGSDSLILTLSVVNVALYSSIFYLIQRANSQKKVIGPRPGGPPFPKKVARGGCPTLGGRFSRKGWELIRTVEVFEDGRSREPGVSSERQRPRLFHF
jgi:hypothetical protein